MTLEPGTYHDVTCRKCGATGTVRVGVTLRGGRTKIRDFIPHKEDCPEYVRRQPQHFRKKGWRSQEKRANELVGARATLMSGAANEDGDGRTFYGWRVESKQTQGHRYALRQTTWEKLTQGAKEVDEEPLLHVEFRSRGSVQRLVVIRREMYDAYCDGTPAEDPSRRNEKSFRITPDIDTPHLVTLDPVGIVLSEPEFRRLKEQHDGHRRAGP